MSEKTTVFVDPYIEAFNSLDALMLRHGTSENEKPEDSATQQSVYHSYKGILNHNVECIQLSAREYPSFIHIYKRAHSDARIRSYGIFINSTISRGSMREALEDRGLYLPLTALTNLVQEDKLKIPRILNAADTYIETFRTYEEGL